MSQEIKDGLWKGQVSTDVASDQKQFDVIFGIIVPVLCLVLDPTIFRDSFFGGDAYLGGIRLFAYLSIGLGIILLRVWLSLSSKWTSAYLISAFSAIFFVGGILAAALGVALLPMSVAILELGLRSIIPIGLLYIIGGLTPFLPAFVFLRNGVQAFRRIQPTISKRSMFVSMIVGVILVVGIPAAINWGTSIWVSRSVHTIIQSTNDDEITSTIDSLQYAFWCTHSCYDEIVSTYAEEKSVARREFLSDVYFKLAGEGIWRRFRRPGD